MGSFATDVRASFRALRRSPTSTIAGVLALAIGIGATTTMLTVVDAIDVRPLPFVAPERLLTLQEIAPVGSPACHPVRGCQVIPTSLPTIEDWRQARSLSAVAGYRLYAEHRWIIDGTASEPLQAIEVTGNFFALLGARPHLGRFFDASELVPDGPAAVVISYDFWRARLGGDSRVLGSRLMLRDMNRQTEGEFSVVGVLPPGFRFLKEDVFLPIQPYALTAPDTRAFRLVLAIGRLATGYTTSQAQAELRGIASHISGEFPETNKGWSATAEPLDGPALLRLSESTVRDAGRGRFVLLGVVSLVLLVAVLNVGALLLARGLARTQELAVRAAIGASRARVVQHLLVESLCIAAMGGAGGVLVALWGVRAARGWLSLESLGIALRLDWRLLGFALAATTFAAVLTGILPALAIRRLDLGTLLQRRDIGGRNPRSMLRVALVSLELACAMVLLTGAGLLTKELRQLRDREPGYDAHGLYGLTAPLPATAMGDTGRTRAIANVALSEIRATDGVSAAALALPSFPRFGIPGRDSVPRRLQPIPLAVDPTFFETVRTPLLRGRAFSATDAAGAEPVAIVDEVTAARFWPGTNALGQQVDLTDEGGRRIAGVVGVAARSKLWIAPLVGEPQPYLYVPIAQAWHERRRSVMLFARVTASRPQPTLAAIRTALRRATGNPVDRDDVESRENHIADELRRQRLDAMALTTFSVLTIALAALGIWAVVAQGVAQRRHEIGIRLALGGTRRHVTRLVVREGIIAATIGLAIGTIGALAVTRVLRATLVRTNPSDPTVFLASAAVLAIVTVLAALLPARRSGSAPPTSALRGE
ncbi:MAG: ADOP family duplicated permease [Gemmatimonadaceae bacterium]